MRPAALRADSCTARTSAPGFAFTTGAYQKNPGSPRHTAWFALGSVASIVSQWSRPRKVSSSFVSPAVENPLPAEKFTMPAPFS